MCFFDDSISLCAWLSTGTAVTVESFLKWKKQFDEEMLAKEVILRKSGVAVSNTAMLPLSAITIGSSGSISSSTGLSASEISSLLGDERPTGKQIFLMQLSVGNGSLGISGTDEEALLLEAEKEDYSDEYFNTKGDDVRCMMMMMMMMMRIMMMRMMMMMMRIMMLHDDDDDNDYFTWCDDSKSQLK